jgi:NADP-dependent 3-hydroxy acid dehydrogenase YdfG
MRKDTSLLLNLVIRELVLSFDGATIGLGNAIARELLLAGYSLYLIAT